MWSKLGGVGPFDNRPSTDLLHHLVKKNEFDMLHVTPQLSIKACLNTWLPKTLVAHQCNSNTTELGLVTYSPSKHSPK